MLARMHILDSDYSCLLSGEPSSGHPSAQRAQQKAHTFATGSANSSAYLDFMGPTIAALCNMPTRCLCECVRDCEYARTCLKGGDVGGVYGRVRKIARKRGLR